MRLHGLSDFQFSGGLEVFSLSGTSSRGSPLYLRPSQGLMAFLGSGRRALKSPGSPLSFSLLTRRGIWGVWGVLVSFSGICFFPAGSGAFGGDEAAEMMRFTAFVRRVWAFRCDLDNLALYVPLSQHGTI